MPRENGDTGRVKMQHFQKVDSGSSRTIHPVLPRYTSSCLEFKVKYQTDKGCKIQAIVKKTLIYKLCLLWWRVVCINLLIVVLHPILNFTVLQSMSLYSFPIFQFEKITHCLLFVFDAFLVPCIARVFALVNIQFQPAQIF